VALISMELETKDMSHKKHVLMKVGWFNDTIRKFCEIIQRKNDWPFCT